VSAPAPPAGTIDVVVPASRVAPLARLLDALRAAWHPALGGVIVAWDGPGEVDPVAAVGRGGAPAVRVVRTGGGRGPAAARNAGWRASGADWIAFLDDDVLPGAGWGGALVADLAAADAGTAAVMGRVRVPLPADRRPTDWERNVARLAAAPGLVTADCAVRRAALEAVGGFDERFRRAYREDTDLELRLARAGLSLARSGRAIVHPVRPAGPLVALALQRGNADDVLLWALHGRAGGHVRVGTKLRYAAIVAAGLAGLAGSRPARLAWLAATARFAARRAAPGPRTPRELLAVAVTSAAIPPLAVWHALRGLVAHRALVVARAAARPAGDRGRGARRRGA
jgi:hypothetical protein